jgi:hypothetical protein
MTARQNIHPSVNEAMVLRNVERRNLTLDNPGICIACGNEQDGCEPDARRYECEACGERKVFGAEELLISGMYHAS